MKWGSPNKVTKLTNGNKMYEFNRVVRVANALTWPFTVRQVCETRFEVDRKDKVVSYSFYGKGCQTRSVR